MSKEKKTYVPNYPVDLHAHTNRSDGADTPQELIDHAAALGMKILALTDHDIRPPEKISLAETGEEVDIVGYAAGRGLRLLRGTEISCETTAEDCHIVCLGCDWTDPFFDKMEQDVVRSKVGSYRELVERLNADGMAMTWDEVLENGGDPVPEDRVQKKMVFELMARKGYTGDWSKAKLLVKGTPAYQIQREKPDPVEVIKSVHAAGGIAVMAHPYLVNEPVRLPEGTMSREAYIERLIEAGLDGIEACYTYGKTSYDGTLTPEEIEAEVRERYQDRLSVISGGSDYHADAKKGVAAPRQLGEAGITLEYFMGNPVLKRILDDSTRRIRTITI